MYSLIFLAFAVIRPSSAWGTLGHDTVAYIAQNFVEDETRTWSQDILDDTSDSYLAKIANFADEYRDDHEWSKDFHYIDSEDDVIDPPVTCYVTWPKDCGATGCVITAIANYTQRVTSHSISDEEVSIALKMLVHFLGDITQPLHTENYDKGGTQLNVKWKGHNAFLGLHGIWDWEMAEELRGSANDANAKAWADDLTREIEGGIYKGLKASWIVGLDIDNATESALRMARDSNALICDVVMPNGGEALEGQELFPEYYDASIGTVELQIAKGGYRLAKWLDAIASANVGQRSSEMLVAQPYL
jgi:hypothetical protein